jgi:hypothetical protein
VLVPESLRNPLKSTIAVLPRQYATSSTVQAAITAGDLTKFRCRRATANISDSAALPGAASIRHELNYRRLFGGSSA